MSNHSTSDSIDEYLSGLAHTIARLDRSAIAHAAEIIVDAAMEGRRVFVFGNGGSAATASHMVNDLNKQACVEGRPLIRAISLTDNVPLITAWSNDDDYAEVFSRQLVNFVEDGDVVVAISTSGESENVIRALELAVEMGARAVGLTGDHGGRLQHLVMCCVHVPSSDIGHQEDAHIAINHALTFAIRRRLSEC